MTNHRWISGIFHSTGVKNVPAFKSAWNAMLGAFGPDGAYAAGNLIAYGRNLTFTTDREFQKAFHDAGPDAFEMTLIWRCHVLHWAARRGLELEGDLVEAGTYKGFSARVLCNMLNLAAQDRLYWLYDRFEVPKEELLRMPEHSDDLCDKVRAKFSDVPNVRVVKGSLPDSLAGATPQRIAFLHVDLNNAAAEIGTLDALYDRISPGGIIILDDYGWMNYRAQRDAHDAWFNARGKMVLELPTGQGMVIR
jgi:O-methyltransferase